MKKTGSSVKHTLPAVIQSPRGHTLSAANARKYARLLCAAIWIAILCAFGINGATASTAPDGTIEVLDSIRIPWDWRISELSGLAWDEDEQLLYVISDLGHLIHYKVEVRDDKIRSLIPVFFGPISLTSGAETFRDTEDLVAINSVNGIKGDTELAIVFEDGPAAARFSAKGQFIENIVLPTPLLDRSAYRQVNQRLESIALTPDHGFIVAPQTPLKSESRKRHTIYSTNGQEWTFKAIRPKRSSIKAMEQMPDGSLLVIEAVNDGGILGAIGLGGKEDHIRRLTLASCNDSVKCSVTDYPISTGDLIRGRFEGIANISDDLFLLVTDETFGGELMLVRIPRVTQ
jgi:hypothetical protein